MMASSGVPPCFPLLPMPRSPIPLKRSDCEGTVISVISPAGGSTGGVAGGSSVGCGGVAVGCGVPGSCRAVIACCNSFAVSGFSSRLARVSFCSLLERAGPSGA